ncbi:MAG: Stk1 family PASTA domain-containing Ser/Thr kinase [Aeromicrobium sp.]
MALTSDEALVGRVLSERYLIGERIARGGMASVFQATDQRLDREVAIKIMHHGLGDDQQFTQRFVREAKSAAKLNHRNVVSVFDQGTDGEVTYLVMEYVPGHTLRDVMRAESPMTPYRALELLEQVLIALSAAHAARIIHRDVKPENVLITPDGDVKVADFGLARAVSAATTATGGTLIGTVSYLAPEIVTNDGADARSDVYACGAMLFEMLTGIKPHSGESPIQVAYKHVHEDIAPPSTVQQGIPPYVDALVARATVRDRDQRSTDARVLLQQVRSVQRALGAGLTDDPELVADLAPGGRVDQDAAATVAVPRAAVAAGVAQSAGRSAPTEMVRSSDDTMQWSAGLTDTPPVVARDAAKPLGLHPEMSREDYDRATTKPHSRRGRKMLILAVLLALLAGGLTWYYTDLRYSSTPVLNGSTEKVARQNAEAEGFGFKVVERTFSEDDPLGTVISTDPGAGDKILPGSTIEAVVSKGPDRVSIPKGNLTGLTLGEAKRVLAKVDLVLGKRTTAYDEDVPRNRIVKADGISASTLLKRGDKVPVVVSKGPKPIAIDSQVGRTVDEATAALRGAGFLVTTSTAFDDKVKKGIVVSQDPADGKGYKGDTIALTVSKGPELVAVPDVKGRPRDEATRILEKRGFKVRTFGPGNFTVSSQSPNGGVKRRKGSTVTITSVPFL